MFKSSVVAAAICLFSCVDVNDPAIREWVEGKGCDKVKELCKEGPAILPPMPSPPVPLPTAPGLPSIDPKPPVVVVAAPTPTVIPSPSKPVKDCSLLRFGDGNGGNLFLKSHTKSGWKFLTAGAYGKPDRVFFCTKGKCSKPSPDAPACGGWANPDGLCGGCERWHSCTPGPAEEIRIDDCEPLKPGKKCLKNGRCD
jgi:hypothetical protein